MSNRTQVIVAVLAVVIGAPAIVWMMGVASGVIPGSTFLHTNQISATPLHAATTQPKRPLTLEQRVSRVERDIAAIRHSLDEIEAELAEIQADVAEIETLLRELIARVEANE